jgi:alpha-glucosidase
MATLNLRPRFALANQTGNHLELTADSGCRIELFVLADDIVRVLVLPEGELRGPRTWAIAPGMEEAASAAT